MPKSFFPLSQQALNFDRIEDLMLIHGRYDELTEVQRIHMLKKEEEYMQRVQFPTNPHDPIFYHVFESTLPTEELYRLIPAGK